LSNYIIDALINTTIIGKSTNEASRDLKEFLLFGLYVVQPVKSYWKLLIL